VHVYCWCTCTQLQLKSNDTPPTNELDASMEFTLLAKARSNPNLIDTGDVKEEQLGDDMMDFSSGGNNFPAIGVFVKDFQRL